MERGVIVGGTDTNDAVSLAQIVRTGWYREVAVKSGSSALLVQISIPLCRA